MGRSFDQTQLPYFQDDSRLKVATDRSKLLALGDKNHSRR
jgi:hypothetical protein